MSTTTAPRATAEDQALFAMMQSHLDRHPADWAMREHLAALCERTGRTLYAGLQRLLVRYRKRPHPPTAPHPPGWLQQRGCEHAIYNWTWWAKGKGGGEDPLSVIGERWGRKLVVYQRYHYSRVEAEASLLKAARTLEGVEDRLAHPGRREDEPLPR